jgi:hypothetical protein
MSTSLLAKSTVGTSNPSISSLPTELWILVASYISKPGLACLGVTSSHFLSIIRPLLYHDIEVKAEGHRSNASVILNLLSQNESLARRVVKLKLTRFANVPDHELEDLPALIDLDALTNMVSLKCITLSGPVFRNPLEQIEFGRVLAVESGIPLEELVYGGDSILPCPHLGGIGGLKTVVWVSSYSGGAFLFTSTVE